MGNINKSIYHGKLYQSQNIFVDINSEPCNKPSAGLLHHYYSDVNDVCKEKNYF